MKNQEITELIATHEEMKNEAIKRMKYLDVLPDVYNLFKKDNKLYYSERVNKTFNAVLYFATEEMTELIKNFENKTGHLVYHIQLLHTEFGDMISLIYVSKYKSEWKLFWESFSCTRNNKSNYLIVNAHVINGEIKESGTIGIRPSMGGIERIW